MFLITVTNWKYKAGVLLRLVLFLVLIGLVIPQLLNYVAAEISSLKSHPEGIQPPALRVEKPHSVKAGQDNFIEKLQQFYRGAL
jgi:hypothetical protein